MYNDMYFQQSKVRFDRAIKYEESNQVNSEALKLYQYNPKIPSMTELFQESGNYLLLFKETELKPKCVLYNGILQSKAI